MVKWLQTSLFAVLFAASSAVGASHAQAQDPTKGEVIVILAKEAAGAVDPSLRPMAALRRAPFNAFRSMEVLSRPQLRLVPSQPSEVRLPNGRSLRVTLQQVLPDGRYRVRVSINRNAQNDYLPLLQVVASPGDPFLVAGQAHQGGTLVVAIRVGEPRAPAVAPPAP